MGLYTGKRPKFVKQYAAARDEMVRGVKDYMSEVREGSFPEDKAYLYYVRRSINSSS
jgi:3-methyl-2-oxobutanoate hydroxymethyltransferase